MKPAPFDYLRPDSAEEALAALAGEGDAARILAGGQSLAPMLNMRVATPRLLVDIGRLAELRTVALRDGALEVGAAVTQAELELATAAGPHPPAAGAPGPSVPRLRGRADMAALDHLPPPPLAGEGRGGGFSHPLLAAALPHIGHDQTRSRGTVCGSIAHADPSAELPLCLVALGGTVLLRSENRRREMAADEFLLGALATACEPDEMVEAVRFPLPRPGAGHAFREVARRHGDFALAAFAAIATAEGLRLAVGGVADRPAARDFPDLAGDALDDALDEFAWDLDARDDPHATARYRRELVRRVGRRTIEEARSCRF